MTPYVKAVFRTPNAGSVVSVRYTLDKSENLAVGDTVVVTAEFDADSLLQQGYICLSLFGEYHRYDKKALPIIAALTARDFLIEFLRKDIELLQVNTERISVSDCRLRITMEVM